MEFDGLLKRECYREDLRGLTSQVKEHESLLRLKRRWLMDLPLSVSEQKRIEEILPPNDKILPESFLREDDVSYEEIRTCIEKGFAAPSCAKEPPFVQENVLVANSRDALQNIFNLLDEMTNKGLCSFIKILTGGLIHFEKTNWCMKRKIRELLPKVTVNKSDIYKMKLNQLVEVLIDPRNFHGNGMVLPTTSEAYRVAAVNVLDGLGDFPSIALCAMHRKLRGVRGYIPSIKSKKSGWGRDSLISVINKTCIEMLSKLDEVDEPVEELTGALGIAGLTLKLIMNRPAVFEFRNFSPEIEALQNDIAKAIHLLDKSKIVSLIELKKVQLLLDPDCELSVRSLRQAIRNLLTDYLYECSDMDNVPDCLVEILDIINRRCQRPPCRKQPSPLISSSPQELMKELIQNEVEGVLTVSGHTKEVVLDFLPEHEFDADFAHAYMEDFEGSDTQSASDEDVDVDDVDVGDSSLNHEYHSYNSYDQMESIGETMPADQSPLSTSNGDDCSDMRSNVTPDSMHITKVDLGESPSFKEPKVLVDECVTFKEYPLRGSADSFKVKTEQTVYSPSHSPARNSCHNNLKKEEASTYSIDTPKYIFSDVAVEESNTFSQQSRSRNQYLDVQEACDVTSMLAYCSVGHMLDKLAKIEGIELYHGDRLYLKHHSSTSQDSEESQSSRMFTSKFLRRWKKLLKD